MLFQKSVIENVNQLILNTINQPGLSFYPHSVPSLPEYWKDNGLNWGVPVLLEYSPVLLNPPSSFLPPILLPASSIYLMFTGVTDSTLVRCPSALNFLGIPAREHTSMWRSTTPAAQSPRIWRGGPLFLPGTSSLSRSHGTRALTTPGSLTQPFRRSGILYQSARRAALGRASTPGFPFLWPQLPSHPRGFRLPPQDQPHPAQQHQRQNQQRCSQPWNRGSRILSQVNWPLINTVRGHHSNNFDNL